VVAGSTFTVGDASGPNLRGTFVAFDGGKILLGRAGNEGR